MPDSTDASLGRCLLRYQPRTQREILRDLGADSFELNFMIPFAALIVAAVLAAPVVLMLIAIAALVCGVLLGMPAVPDSIAVLAMAGPYAAAFAFLLWHSWGRHPGYLHLYEHGFVHRGFFRQRIVRFDEVVHWGHGRPLRWHERWVCKINQIFNQRAAQAWLASFGSCLTFTLRDDSIMSFRNLLVSYPAEAVEQLLEALRQRADTHQAEGAPPA